jgi:putative spermidine/putrescine transport system ATP-binding protein
LNAWSSPPTPGSAPRSFPAESNSAWPWPGPWPTRPRLLLLDEPLGALDLRLREELLLFLHKTLKEEGVTTLLVTHDQGEAFLLAQRVALMREGRIVQVGRPEEVYSRPIDPWAARFLGHKNLLSPEESRALGPAPQGPPPSP